MNQPYVKKYKDGLVTNKITKNEPYLNLFPNRRARRKK